MATAPTKLLTAEEFAQLPAPPDGYRQELVRGVIITMPPPQFRHGVHQFQAARLLDNFVRTRKMGRVVPETGVITERDPDSVRGPDVSYWSAETLPLHVMPEAYADVVADLCIEVLSRWRNLKKLLAKIKEYFAAGVRMVWVIDPKKRQIVVYRSPSRKRILMETDTISGEDVIPGFTCRVAEFFE